VEKHKSVKKKYETHEPSVDLDFRQFLQNELIQRCRSNPQYSLRAFARFLEVDASFLSKVFALKRPMTKAFVKKCAKRLNLDPERCREYINGGDNNDSSSVSNYNQLTLDHFRVISEWYHYAILEITGIEGFEPSEKWISKALNISIVEVQTAVERLVRMDFLEITTQGKWINKSGNNTTVGNDFTDVAFRKLQRSVLEKALVALDEVPFEFRDQSSMTLATHPRLIPEARQKIKRFRRELTDFLESVPQKTTVYNIGISIYPISKIKKEK